MSSTSQSSKLKLTHRQAIDEAFRMGWLQRGADDLRVLVAAQRGLSDAMETQYDPSGDACYQLLEVIADRIKKGDAALPVAGNTQEQAVQA